VARPIARRLAVALLVALGSLLPGCGSPRPPDAPAGSAPAPPTLPPAQGTFIFARGGDSVGLDPAHEDDGESLKVAESIFDCLVEFKPGTTEVEPSLAERWDISPDGLVYTFHLRQGVSFHDGTPLDADAVLFSLLRQHDENHPFHSVGGAWKYWGAMDMSKIIASIKAPDPATVVITLNTPNAPFLANLAMPFAGIVSPTALKAEGEGFSQRPVGSGPFKFVSWEQEQKIVLAANDSYWGGRPKLDRVIFEVVKDKNVRALRFKSGEIHGLDDPGPAELEVIKDLPHAKILQQAGMNVGYLAMNTMRKPFDDVRVRIAINLAVDKERIVRDIFRGTGQVAKNPLPPTLWGYADDVQDFPHDPAKAKQLLAEAGFPNGFETTLWYMPVSRPYMPDGKEVAESIQLDLQEIGITARMVTYDWSAYLKKTNDGEHDMALLGWSGDNGDPDNFLYNLLSIHAAEQRPSQNIAFYKNAEFDRLITEAKRVTDQGERAKLYQQAQHAFHADPPWVCLAHNIQTVVVRSDVEGFVLYPDTRKDFRTVSFKP
jgi:ABC-type transport system substrate-binding protein